MACCSYGQFLLWSCNNEMLLVAASGVNTMMKVMVGARVESDRARSALDG